MADETKRAAVNATWSAVDAVLRSRLDATDAVRHEIMEHVQRFGEAMYACATPREPDEAGVLDADGIPHALWDAVRQWGITDHEYEHDAATRQQLGAAHERALRAIRAYGDARARAAAAVPEVVRKAVRAGAHENREAASVCDDDDMAADMLREAGALDAWLAATAPQAGEAK